jgi:hypothetical protein
VGSRVEFSCITVVFKGGQGPFTLKSDGSENLIYYDWVSSVLVVL